MTRTGHVTHQIHLRAHLPRRSEKEKYSRQFGFSKNRGALSHLYDGAESEMLTLYYSPGRPLHHSAHHARRDRHPYDANLSIWQWGSAKGRAYLKINPHGKIPALAIDGTVLTENVAISTYLARRVSGRKILPAVAIR